MKIIINSCDNSHAKEIENLLKWAEICYFCTSFIDKSGVELLLPSLIEASKNNNFKVHVYSNNNQKYTKPWVTKKLNELKCVNHLAVKPNGRRLHSKIYLFVNKNQYIAIVGSANLTGNGLIKNEELSIKYSGEIKSKQYLELTEYFGSLVR